jgi:thioester reductase-like protein
MKQAESEETVLVTGMPSLLACEIARETLRTRPSARVIAVVRPSQAARAEAFADALDGSARGRVELLDGDVSAMDLGLSGAEYCALAKRVTCIQNAEQCMDPSAPRAQLEQANLQATVEAIELGRACTRLQRLVHHSSVRVFGDRRGRFAEDDLDVGQRFTDAVQETKARAEKLVRQAMARLPVTVVRSATVVGHSVTGDVDGLDGPYALFAVLLGSPPDWVLPLPGDCDGPLPLVPFDYVARAAVALAHVPEAAGKTFHLTDEQPLSARRVFELVAEAGGRVQPRGAVPTPLAKMLLRAPGLARSAASAQGFLDTLRGNTSYDTRNARAWLPDAVGPCPPFASYVNVVADAVQSRLRDRRGRERHGAPRPAARLDEERPLPKEVQPWENP